jgi:hypothetical protein
MTQQYAPALLHGLLSFGREQNFDALRIYERWLEAGLTHLPPTIPADMLDSQIAILWTLPAGLLMASPEHALRVVRKSCGAHPATEAALGAALTLFLLSTGTPIGVLLRELSLLTSDFSDDFRRTLHSIGHTIGWVNTRHALLHVGRSVSPIITVGWALCLYTRTEYSMRVSAPIAGSESAWNIVQVLLGVWSGKVPPDSPELDGRALTLVQNTPFTRQWDSDPPETHRETSQG